MVASGWPSRQRASYATTMRVWGVSPTETPVKDSNTSASYQGLREMLIGQKIPYLGAKSQGKLVQLISNLLLDSVDYTFV